MQLLLPGTILLDQSHGQLMYINHFWIRL